MVDDLLSKGLRVPGYSEAVLARGLNQAEQLSAQKGPLTGPDSEKATKEAATNFEALLLHQMFQAMWASVPEGELLGGGREGQYFRDMLTEGLANEVAGGQGIGIKEVILKELTPKAKLNAYAKDGEE